mgnify:CR=1 FL=1
MILVLRLLSPRIGCWLLLALFAMRVQSAPVEAELLPGASERDWLLVIEADGLHSAANVAHMAQGLGLTDEMRWPWLEAVCAAARSESRRPVVIACSALRRVYRDFLRNWLGDSGEGEVRFLFLDGPRSLIEDRLRARAGHFATVTLLDSQLATLEPPSAN